MVPKPKISGVITGAAGGIARATIDAISTRFDGKLSLLDINADGLAATCNAQARDGLELIPYTVDLCNDKQVRETMHAIGSQTEGIDLLFTNAGIMTSPDAFENTDTVAIDRSISLNFRSVATSTLMAWPYLSKSNGCVVVNASGAGRRPLASDVIYSASKAAAIMFARANAIRQPETNIRFNVVCPGVVDTPILNDARTGEWRDEVQDFVKAFQLIQPAEIAEVVLELFSDRAANGEVRTVENQPR